MSLLGRFWNLLIVRTGLWFWILNHRFFCELFGVDYKSGCWKKTGCPA